MAPDDSERAGQLRSCGGREGAVEQGDRSYLQPLGSDPGTVPGPPTVKKPRLMLSFTAGGWRHQYNLQLQFILD